MMHSGFYHLKDGDFVVVRNEETSSLTIRNTSGNHFPALNLFFSDDERARLVEVALITPTVRVPVGSSDA